MRPVALRRDLTVEEGREVMRLWDEIQQFNASISVERDEYVRNKLVEYRDEKTTELSAIVRGKRRD